MRRHRQDLEVFSEMNLTNMLDTAFILLLAFLLVAPMIKHGIELDLPQVGPGSLATEQHTVTVVIAKSPGEGLPDRLYIEDQRVTVDEMERIINQRRDRYEKVDVIVEGDKGANYGTFVEVLYRLQVKMGIENVGLPTAPEPQ